MKRVLILFVLLTSSCAFLPQSLPVIFEESYVGSLPSAEVQGRIIDDCVAFFTEKYPPGYTELNLVYPKEKNEGRVDEFSLNLESALRQKGFTISSDAKLRIGWFFDSLSLSEKGVDNNEWYIKLWLSSKVEKQIVTRGYNKNGEPVAGFATGRL